MKTLHIGLIGSGFMGKAHAWGYRNVGAVFRLPVAPVLEILADATPELAATAARDLGFARSTGDWRELVADPKVDVVSITTPPQLHAEMALAAIAAGKHTYLEKPMAPTGAIAKRMLDAAEQAGVKTQIGFNYLKNPMIALAREIVASGEIGDIVSFRGIHAEDYMAGSDTPWHWRLDPAVGGGVVQDLGTHIIAMARHLVGPIVEVSAQVETVVKARPVSAGSSQTRARGGGRHRARDGALRARLQRYAGSELGVRRPQDADRVRAGRLERGAAFQPGALQRAAPVPVGGAARAATAFAPSSPGPSIRPTARSVPRPVISSASTT